MIFVIELVAFRWGTAKLAALGIAHDPHGHGIPSGGGHAAHGPEGSRSGANDRIVMSEGGAYNDNAAKLEKRGSHDGSSEGNYPSKQDAEMAVLNYAPSSVVDSPATQIIGVMILEFGVLLHRSVSRFPLAL